MAKNKVIGYRLDVKALEVLDSLIPPGMDRGSQEAIKEVLALASRAKAAKNEALTIIAQMSVLHDIADSELVDVDGHVKKRLSKVLEELYRESKRKPNREQKALVKSYRDRYHLEENVSGN